MVNIALIGYGKMGQVIEKIVKEKGHEIKAMFTILSRAIYLSIWY